MPVYTVLSTDEVQS